MHTNISKEAGLDIDFSQTASLGNTLLDRLAVMREADPIYFSKANGGVWIVTGHVEVAEGFAGKKPLSAFRLPALVVAGIPEDEREAKVPYLMKTTPHWVINMDRPAQWRLRILAQKAFGPALAESLRPAVRSFIEDAFADAEGLENFDFVDKVARRIPARTILKLLGLPESLYDRLHHWSIALNAALGGVGLPEETIIEGEKVLLEMREIFLPEIEKRRLAPTDDFISALVTARDDDGAPLAEEELLGLLYVALIAGHDSTANTIALGTAALADLPDARRFIREHPEKLSDAVMELMRYIAMSTAMARLALEDFEWNGNQIKAGQFVFLMIAGANRDPQVFAEPDQFDATRSQARNMTFAPGLHLCIGLHLAKVQIQEYFAVLLDRYEFELLDERLNFSDSIIFRGVDSMNVRLTPRRMTLGKAVVPAHPAVSAPSAVGSKGP